MSTNDTSKEQMLNLYDQLLREQIKSLHDLYYDCFSNISSKDLYELYLTYYAKEKMNPAFVYFIYNKYTNLIKIGKSNNPFKRLNELTSMFKNHFGVDNALSMLRIVFIPSGKDYTVEKMFHKKYEKYRTFGEWFNIPQNEIYEQLPEFLSYDTDNFLENEGFDSNIVFKNPTKYEYAIFALDTLDEYTLKFSDDNEKAALFLKKMICDDIYKKFNINNYKFLGLFDIRNFNVPFSVSSNNKTWEMFKWLYLNKDTYALSTCYKLNKDDNITKHVLSLNKNAEILDYYELRNKIANDICFLNYDNE
jgi:hypothetical protein